MNDPSPTSDRLHGAAKVILVGQMGAGKSTIARLLAARWPGYSACDLDHEIEADGRSISAIFEDEGEAGFRVLEAAALSHALARPERLVIATGGGAPCQPGAIEQMRAAGTVIWLAASPDVLARRLIVGQGGPRPLVAGLDLAKAERFLSRQLEARLAFYQQAHVTVDASLPLDEAASLIDRLGCALVDDPA